MPWNAYQSLLCRTIADESKEELLIDKSRQMMATWEVSFYFLHAAMTRGPYEIGIKGRVDKETAYILRDRIMVLHKNLPLFLRKVFPAYHNKSTNIIRFPFSGSTIYGLSEDPDSVQGKQWWGFMGDECSRMKSFAKVYFYASATEPRQIYLSTPGGEGDWSRLVQSKPMNIAQGFM